MDFFQNQATFYHFDKDNVTRIEFNNIYFRDNVISRSNSKGAEKGSSGSITIPTENVIEIMPGDYVIKGIIKDEFDYVKLVQKYQVFKVVSVADYRKGNLQHYRIEVSE